MNNAKIFILGGIMKDIKLPLIRKNNLVVFDVKEIEKRSFISELLGLKTEHFRFKNFGLCKDNNYFYLSIDKGVDKATAIEINYLIKLEEFNEEFFVHSVQELKENDTVSCDVLYL